MSISNIVSAKSAQREEVGREDGLPSFLPSDLYKHLTALKLENYKMALGTLHPTHLVSRGLGTS